MVNKYNAKTAKLDRQLIFKIGNGTLGVSSSAMDFMLITAQFIAKDGRIYFENDEIRRQLCMQNKTFIRVVNELVQLDLLSIKEGFFYSHFHVLSNGEKTDPSYVRNIKGLTSAEVLSLNKSKKRFFLYAASFTSMGTIKSVSVEALYSNKYYSGVNYIESYQELSEILFDLVNKGLLVVYINGKAFDNTSADFKEQFHSYCGFDTEKRKKRMSKTREHIIGLKIHDRLLASVIPNESSKAEFHYFAEKYHVYHQVMRAETIPLFIDVQNKLFDLFGTVGVALYRESLISYLAAEQENVLYHDLFSSETGTKAVNTMVDFYLIKNIEQIISNVLNKGQETLTSVEEYFNNEDNLAELVSYFIEISSDDHKVMLEEKLEQIGVDLSSLVQSVPQQNIVENHWLLLNEHISHIYSQFDLTASKQITPSYQQTVIRQWASEGILARKEVLQQAVQQLKEKVVFFPSRTKFTIDSNIQKDNENLPVKKMSLGERFRLDYMQKFKEMNITEEDLTFDF
ncbi:hypothetical protein JFL43_20585 [Viridibacillus sp. YIM B01967]|uniref:Uncharacterized protein n=1 Tax=Viridibacillus soli TaxID=2798301 RepID=A0ABS1HCW5_9BACL|nr:hypothetical protein [Viridibacillus soli]MBK3497181.1 hypothetical protein [Viridibacillus soli]